MTGEDQLPEDLAGDGPQPAEDRKALLSRAKRDKLAREREVAELQALLSTYGGRAFIWRLLSECGLYHDDFAGEAALAMARNTGKRAIGLWTLKEVLTADANAYSLMRAEGTKREHGA